MRGKRRRTDGRGERGRDGGRDPVGRAERILAGGGRPPEAHELFELIHAVNPSSQAGLPERERRRLYSLKSKLQSLLILTYRDAIEVQRVTGKPHLVGLQHRFVRSDACHAVLDSLDTPARNWAESQLAMQ